jgi:hypothetical protein
LLEHQVIVRYKVEVHRHVTGGSPVKAKNYLTKFSKSIKAGCEPVVTTLVLSLCGVMIALLVWDHVAKV